MIFTITRLKKSPIKIQAKDLNEAEKIANKKYPDWTEVRDSRYDSKYNK